MRVLATRDAVTVQVEDRGVGWIEASTVAPDLEAKVAGREGARVWSMFLIRHMADEVKIRRRSNGSLIELIFFVQRPSLES